MTYFYYKICFPMYVSNEIYAIYILYIYYFAQVLTSFVKQCQYRNAFLISLCYFFAKECRSTCSSLTNCPIQRKQLLIYILYLHSLHGTHLLFIINDKQLAPIIIIGNVTRFDVTRRCINDIV